jgi:hypothetical protein
MTIFLAQMRDFCDDGYDRWPPRPEIWIAGNERMRRSFLRIQSILWTRDTVGIGGDFLSGASGRRPGIATSSGTLARYGRWNGPLAVGVAREDRRGQGRAQLKQIVSLYTA